MLYSICPSYDNVQMLEDDKGIKVTVTWTTLNCTFQKYIYIHIIKTSYFQITKFEFWP